MSGTCHDCGHDVCTCNAVYLNWLIGYCEQVARDGIRPGSEWFGEQAEYLRGLMTVPISGKGYDFSNGVRGKYYEQAKTGAMTFACHHCGQPITPASADKCEACGGPRNHPPGSSACKRIKLTITQKL